MKAKVDPLSTLAPKDILYVDNHLLVLRKPAGMLVQGDKSGDLSLLDIGRQWVKEEFNKPGEVFLGLIHRLDRPVSGVVVFGRTSKAASRLSAQFRDRIVKKRYWALVQGETPAEGKLIDRISRHGMTSHISRRDDEAGQHAELSFRTLAVRKDVSWVEIALGTGRHHQIRVQFANFRHPILGDLRYGCEVPFSNGALALHARQLTLIHPTRDEELTFEAEPEIYWPKWAREE